MPDYTPVTYTGNGSTKTYSITFSDYLKQSNVTVKVDGVLKTNGGPGTYDYTINDATKVVTFTTAPLNGATILIERATPTDLSTNEVEFSSGGDFAEGDMNDVIEQSLLIDQELKYADSQLSSRIDTLESASSLAPDVVFSTVSLLEANTTSVADGKWVTVKGYYDEQDGRFGPALVCDRQDTSSSGDGLSVFVDAIGQRFKRTFVDYVNASWGGVKADATFDQVTNSGGASIASATNDISALNTVTAYCIANKLKLILPRGIIRIDATWEIHDYPIEIEGQVSSVQWSDLAGTATSEKQTGTVICRYANNAADYFTAIEIRGLYGAGKWIGGDFSDYSNLSQHGSFSGIYLTDAAENATASGAVGYGIELRNLSKWRFFDNRVSGLAGGAIDAYKIDDCRIYRNHFGSCGSQLNNTTTEANSNYVFQLHRDVASDSDNTNTLDVYENTWEANFIVDVGLGPSGSETGDSVSVRFYDNYYKLDSATSKRTLGFVAKRCELCEVDFTPSFRGAGTPTSSTPAYLAQFEAFDNGKANCSITLNDDTNFSSLDAYFNIITCQNSEFTLSASGFSGYTNGFLVSETGNTNVQYYGTDSLRALTEPRVGYNEPLTSVEENVTNVFDSVCSFPGSSSRLDIAGTADTDIGTGPYTVEGFFKFTGANAGFFSNTHTASLGAGPQDAIRLQVNAGDLQVVATDSGASQTRGSTIYSDFDTDFADKWIHIGLTRTGTTLKVFVNGQRIFNETNAAWAVDLNNTWWGVGNTVTYYLNGKVGLFRMWYGVKDEKFFSRIAQQISEDPASPTGDATATTEGLLCKLDFRQPGLLIKDATTNHLDGFLRGVTNTVLGDFNLFTYTDHTSTTYLYGQNQDIVPSGYFLDRVYYDNDTANDITSFVIENGSGGADWVSSTTLTNGTKGFLTVADPLLAEGSNGKLFISASTWTSRDVKLGFYFKPLP